MTLAPYGGVSNATLILRDLAFEDMGDFHIEAINSHGNDTKVVKLRVKGGFVG